MPDENRVLCAIRKVLDGNTRTLETDSKRLFREVLKELDLNPVVTSLKPYPDLVLSVPSLTGSILSPAGPSENTVAGMPSLSIGLVPPPAPWTRE